MKETHSTNSTRPDKRVSHILYVENYDVNGSDISGGYQDCTSLYMYNI